MHAIPLHLLHVSTCHELYITTLGRDGPGVHLAGRRRRHQRDGERGAEGSGSGEESEGLERDEKARMECEGSWKRGSSANRFTAQDLFSALLLRCLVFLLIGRGVHVPVHVPQLCAEVHLPYY